MALGTADLRMLEPLRRFLGRITIGNATLDDIAFSFSLSEVTSAPIEVRRHAEVAYYPGHITPNSIRVTIYGYVGKIASVINSFYNVTYKPQAGQIGAVADVKKEIRLEALKPDGSTALTVTLKGGWVTSCNAGEINWTSNEIVELVLDIRYDSLEISAG